MIGVKQDGRSDIQHEEVWRHLCPQHWRQSQGKWVCNIEVRQKKRNSTKIWNILPTRSQGLRTASGVVTFRIEGEMLAIAIAWAVSWIVFNIAIDVDDEDSDLD